MSDVIKRKNSKIVHQNPYWSLFEDTVKLKDESFGSYFRVHKNPGVMIIAENDNQEIALIKQYRYPHEKYFWEFPAGNKIKNNSLLDTAKAELLEEIGYTAKTWKQIGSFCPLNGLLDTTSYLFQATQLKKASSKELSKIQKDHTHNYENISEIWFVTKDKIKEMIRDNDFQDSLSLAAFSIINNIINK